MEHPISIAVVDDEEAFAQSLKARITAFLTQQQIPAEVAVFTSGHAMLDSCIAVQYDLVFLDIDMPDVTGLDIARKLRMKDTPAELIFITNYDNLVYDTIRYAPFRFIRKSRLAAEFEEALQAFLAGRRSRMTTFFFLTEQGRRPVNAADVVYVEVQSHKLTVHLPDEVFLAGGNLSDVEAVLAEHGFLRIHKSYLVNFRYISRISYKEIVLDDGTALPLSRGKLESVKRDMMRWTRRF